MSPTPASVSPRLAASFGSRRRRHLLLRLAAKRLAEQTARDPAARSGSVILLWMSGGPSQLDTFDLKPGHEHGGPFKEIATSVPGIKTQRASSQGRQADGSHGRRAAPWPPRKPTMAVRPTRGAPAISPAGLCSTRHWARSSRRKWNSPERNCPISSASLPSVSSAPRLTDLASSGRNTLRLSSARRSRGSSISPGSKLPIWRNRCAFRTSICPTWHVSGERSSARASSCWARCATISWRAVLLHCLAESASGLPAKAVTLMRSSSRHQGLRSGRGAEGVA